MQKAAGQKSHNIFKQYDLDHVKTLTDFVKKALLPSYGAIWYKFADKKTYANITDLKLRPDLQLADIEASARMECLQISTPGSREFDLFFLGPCIKSFVTDVLYSKLHHENSHRDEAIPPRYVNAKTPLMTLLL